jgi:hypothetical protein
MDMPICANAAAETASIASANNSERMEEMKRIVLPFAWSSLACPVMLCCCGLRGWRGTISGRDVLHTFVSLAKQFCDDLLISELLRLINNAHNEFAADR